MFQEKKKGVCGVGRGEEFQEGKRYTGHETGNLESGLRRPCTIDWAGWLQTTHVTSGVISVRPQDYSTPEVS